MAWRTIAMRMIVIAGLLCGYLIGPSAFGQDAASVSVKYTVHSDKVVSTINQGIYGQFLEHIYNSVHGGIWGGSDS